MFAQALQQYGGQQQQGPGSWSGGSPWAGHPMMWWAGSNPNAFWLFGLLWLVTWILVIVVLVALVRWLWKKGDKIR
ncbi:hypothetical protein HYW39_01800 [Candidatus Curtissbacteria bacterium]|nr:hypothetical protein [Candidatus Curtissbacteria bacterium]